MMIDYYLEEYPVSYKCPRVTIKKDRCDGLPCVRGTDIPTKNIATLAHNGMTQDQVLEKYPELTMEDLKDVYLYYKGPFRLFYHLELDYLPETEKVFL